MSTTELTFTLVQAAKSKGGDKYACDTNSDFTIYVPQTISRGKEAAPVKNLKLDISAV